VRGDLRRRDRTTRRNSDGEEIIDIVDSAGSPLLREDGTPVLDKDGNPVMVVDRTAIRARQVARGKTPNWVAARMASRRYGDKVTLAGDADNPIATVDYSAVASKLLHVLLPLAERQRRLAARPRSRSASLEATTWSDFWARP